MSKDRELIKQLAVGSEYAMESIYDIYSGRLYGFCFRYAKSKEVAEEVVQDVFIKLWNMRSTITSDAPLGALLFVMAKNHLINIYRSTLRSPIYEEYVDYCNRIDISESSTDKKIEYDDFCKELSKCVSKLNKTQQLVFNCCKIEQLSGKETAAKLGLSEQTVKNQLSIAVKALKQQLMITSTMFFYYLFQF